MLLDQHMQQNVATTNYYIMMEMMLKKATLENPKDSENQTPSQVITVLSHSMHYTARCSSDACTVVDRMC